MITRFGRPRAGILLLFAALLLLGFCTASDYGVYCDQLSEQVILSENMKEYAVRLLGENAEAVRYYDSLGVRRISESIEIDHGQCAYYPLVPLLNAARNAGNTALVSALWHGYAWFWFWLGVIALYGFSREMGRSRPLALAGAALLALSPRFFAEGHYNNKDVVLLSLTLALFFLGLRFLKRPTLWRGVLFSLAGAMAANTKIVGLIVWGMFALCAILLVTAGRKWSPRMAGTALATALCFAVVYAALTPAMWNDPPAYFRYLLANASGFTRWPGVVVFRGMVFEHKIHPLPRYYLPLMMLLTQPLYLYPLCAVGQVSALRRLARQKADALRDPKTLTLLCATALWLLFVGYVIIARPLMYNGWRHFYFLFAGVVALGAQGLSAMRRALEGRGRLWRRAAAALLCGCFALSAMGIARNHPYQYAYYNLLAPRDAEESMELDYWDVSTVGAIRQLLSCERNTSLPLVLGARDDMSWFGLDTGETALTRDERARITLAQDENAPYLFVNTTYGRIYGVKTPPEGYRPLFSLRSYGNVICTVYERE